MAQQPGHRRREQYFQLSAQLAQLDTTAVVSLLAASESRAGWGRNQTVELAGSSVFVKRLPVTDVELANVFSTTNLYGLPTYYNYGVGSAGFGVFRELAAHLKTTTWVLHGAIATFPLLYHYRIVPHVGERAGVDLERHTRYVEYWGGDVNIGRYMLDRANAKHELVLFLEYLPHDLEPWLQEHPDQVDRVLDDLRATINFLRTHGVIHFDAHFDNVLTDGEHAYLTDFGLVLDRSFALSEDEMAFFDAHTHYDYGEILSGVGFLLYATYMALPERDKRQLRERYGLDEDRQDHALIRGLLDHIEELHAAGMLKVHERYLTCVVQYREIITLMHDFYADLRPNPKKDTPFPHAQLRRLLKETGFVADPGANSC